MFHTYGATYDDDMDIYDWSNFPFNVTSIDLVENITKLYTENVGTYTVKIETVEDTVEMTPCFKKAVIAAIEIH